MYFQKFSSKTREKDQKVWDTLSFIFLKKRDFRPKFFVIGIAFDKYFGIIKSLIIKGSLFVRILSLTGGADVANVGLLIHQDRGCSSRSIELFLRGFAPFNIWPEWV